MGRIPLGFIAFLFAAIATMKAKKTPSLFIAAERRTTLYSFKRATTARARPRSDSSSRRYSTGKH